MQQTGKFQSSPSLSSEYVENVGGLCFLLFLAKSGDKVSKNSNQTENLTVTEFSMGCNSSTEDEV